MAAFRDWLYRRKVEWIAFVPGNHDAGLLDSPARRHLPICREGVMLGAWRIVHGEGRLPEGPLVHGHEHPWLRWSPKNRAIRPQVSAGRIAPSTIDGPCYLSGVGRLVLPAYSTEAAGANVLPPRRGRSLCCHVIAGDKVFDCGELTTLRHRLSAACR